jgi:hypothetical protein
VDVVFFPAFSSLLFVFRLGVLFLEFSQNWRGFFGDLEITFHIASP